MPNQSVVNLSTWKTAHKQGYIYFLQNLDTGNIKIGHALNVDRRIRDLQTGNEADLILLKKVPGSYNYETIVKRKFQAYRIKREWFEPGLELQKFILWVDPEKSIQDQLETRIPTDNRSVARNRSPDHKINHAQTLSLISY